jgi:hypothetical protein
MKLQLRATLVVSPSGLLLVSLLYSEKFRPHFKKINEGIYVYPVKPADTHLAVFAISQRVVVIDTVGNQPEKGNVLKPYSVAGESIGPLRYYRPVPRRSISRNTASLSSRRSDPPSGRSE